MKLEKVFRFYDSLFLPHSAFRPTEQNILSYCWVNSSFNYFTHYDFAYWANRDNVLSSGYFSILFFTHDMKSGSLVN